MCGYHSNTSSSSATLGVCGKGGGERPGLCDHTGCSGTGAVTCGMMGAEAEAAEAGGYAEARGLCAGTRCHDNSSEAGAGGRKPYPY